MKAVISYAHSDSAMLKRFHKHLAMLRRDHKLDGWYDRNILAGDLLDSEISEHIEGCELFIALVSPDFLDSSYCYDKEMQQAIALHDARRLRIVPIILEPCDWLASPLKRFKALPQDGKPVSEWLNPNAALHDVVTELRRVIEAHTSMRSKGSLRESTAGFTAAAPASPGPSPGLRHRPQLPLVTFPYEIDRFMRNNVLNESWGRLDRNTKRFVTTLGTKLEPIVQIAPVTASRVVLGFECLALGPLGENFSEISAECAGFDAGAVRVCLSIAALETINYLRSHTEPDITDAADLKFSLNLDPVMLDSPLLRPFLRQYRLTIQHNVTFEITETTSTRYLPQLKNLQVDFKLRFSADDVNAWESGVKQQLIGRVDMTKMDHPTFKRAMDVRGEDPAAAIKALRANTVRGKPLVVEGVAEEDYLEFLRRHWDAKKYGELYGQGYTLEPGIYWDREVLSLKGFGLPGGNILRRKLRQLDEEVWNDIDGPNPQGAAMTLQ